MKTANRNHWALLFAAPLTAAALIGMPPAGAAENRTVAAGQVDEARGTLQEARRVVQRMQADPAMRRALQQAKGVFIVPDYARGGAGIVAKGGEGVVMSRLPDGRWSNPAFYNLGGVSVGLQAGASAGQVAFVLMTDKARRVFDAQNNFSLNANAGLAIVDYSAAAQASIGKGEDVIAWSDTEGLFAGANIGVSDIVADTEENRAFYGAEADAPAILAGRVDTSRPATAGLKQALAADRSGVAGRTAGDRTASRSDDGRTAGTSGGERMAAAPGNTGFDGSDRLPARADRN